MIGRIRTSCNCWQRDKKLAIPAEGASTKRVIRLCRRSRAAIRRRERGLLDPFRRTIEDGQQHERNGQGPEQSPGRGSSFLCHFLAHRPTTPPLHHSTTPPLHHSTTPPLHHSIPHEIPCNLSRRFPLDGVEAGSLPAKAAQRKELIVNKD